MTRALFPFHCYMTPAAAKVIGPSLPFVAVKALKALLRNGVGYEVAHQQIAWDEQDLAFSTRFNQAGDLVIEFDVGVTALRDRVILEEDLRREARTVRGIRPDKNRRTRSHS